MSFVKPDFISSLAVDILSYINLGLVIIYLVALLFYDKRRIVEGANDNLTGCFASIGILKFLQDNNIRFENTEVIALCTGSEEIGLRGAKDFCKKHAEEFSDVETIFIALDTIRDYDHMGIYNKDMSGFVKNDPEVCNLLREAGNIAGLENLPYRTVTIGSSDAAAVSRSKNATNPAGFATFQRMLSKFPKEQKNKIILLSFFLTSALYNVKFII
jgi:putative aminopeptidase FrvX